MLKALDRAALRWLRRRSASLEAAGGGRRWEGAGWMPDPNAAILAGNRRAAFRANAMVVNNPHARAAVDSLVANAIGAGIKPQSQHPAAETRRRLNEAFERWTDHADAAGLTDFYGLQALVVRTMAIEGEAFVRMVPAQKGEHLDLRLEVIHPDQVPADRHQDLADGGRVRAGIEYAPDGSRRAYHVFRHRPGDGAGPIDTVRVPASDIIHLFELLTPGQVRGLSRFSTILLRLHELDAYQDAEAVRHKVQALVAGFIRDLDGTAAGFGEQKTGLQQILDAGLQPGTLYNLPPGADITFSNPAGSGGDYAGFVKSQLRAIAAGVGVTYEQISGDLEGVNYSSIRAGLVEVRRRIEQLQWSVIVFQLCRPVWDRWTRLAALSGAIDASELDRTPAHYAVRWVTPGWEWVDPLKDIQAERLAMDAGLQSRSAAVAARGLDIERLDEEIAADKSRAEALGLHLGASSTPDRREPVNDDL